MKGFNKRHSICRNLWDTLDRKPYQEEEFTDGLVQEMQDQMSLLPLPPPSSTHLTALQYTLLGAGNLISDEKIGTVMVITAAYAYGALALC